MHADLPVNDRSAPCRSLVLPVFEQTSSDEISSKPIPVDPTAADIFAHHAAKDPLGRAKPVGNTTGVNNGCSAPRMHKGTATLQKVLPFRKAAHAVIDKSDTQFPCRIKREGLAFREDSGEQVLGPSKE